MQSRIPAACAGAWLAEHDSNVHLDTVPPGFDSFLADIDDKGERRVPSTWEWELRKGRNRMEAVPRNSVGRKGVPSWIVVEY